MEFMDVCLLGCNPCIAMLLIIIAAIFSYMPCYMDIAIYRDVSVILYSISVLCAAIIPLSENFDITDRDLRYVIILSFITGIFSLGIYIMGITVEC